MSKDSKPKKANAVVVEKVFNDEGLEQVTFKVNHGVKKKGEKAFKHPKTAEMLRQKGKVQ